jgi:hypothetical protein
MGGYWNAQAALHAWSEKNLFFSGGAECGPLGRQNLVMGKTDWIKTIVEFWTSRTCKRFTNPAGEEAMWCWAIP